MGGKEGEAIEKRVGEKGVLLKGKEKGNGREGGTVKIGDNNRMREKGNELGHERSREESDKGMIR